MNFMENALYKCIIIIIIIDMNGYNPFCGEILQISINLNTLQN